MTELTIMKRAANLELRLGLSDSEFEHVFGRRRKDVSNKTELKLGFAGDAVAGITLFCAPPEDSGREARKVTLVEKTMKNLSTVAVAFLPPKRLRVVNDYRNMIDIKGEPRPNGRIYIAPLNRSWRGEDAELAHANGTPAPADPRPPPPPAPPVQAAAPMVARSPEPPAHPPQPPAPQPAPQPPSAPPPKFVAVPDAPRSTADPHANALSDPRNAFGRLLTLQREVNRLKRICKKICRFELTEGNLLTMVRMYPPEDEEERTAPRR